MRGMTSPRRTDRSRIANRPHGRATRPLLALLGTLLASGSLTLILAAPAEALPTPSLTSTASGATTVGLDVFDNVNLTGGSAPSGTLTFRLFGPSDPACAGSAVFSSSVTVNGNGSYNSPHFTTAAAGTYQWVVSYSGDASNNPAGPTPCSDPNEAVIVGKFIAALTTTASPTVATGGQIHDTASLNGRAPTGTIDFRLSGPTDTFCSGTPVFTATVPVAAGSGSYQSPAFTPTVAGTYRWQATYSGDANNQPIPISSCLDPGESVVVTSGGGLGTPAIATTASPSVALGGVISDTAVLSGGSSPTGKITFAVFGPTDASCAGTAVSTSMVVVSGDGTYSSAPFTPTVAGTYRFTAAYSGDAANAVAVSACGAAGESVVVTSGGGLGTPAIATTASPSVALGGVISDTAVLSGGSSPTGKITFAVFGPTDASCAGTAVSTSMVVVSGDGTYSSAPFTPTVAGTYRFTAAYSGDAANAVAVSACGAAGESVVVTSGGGLGTPAIATTASPTVALGGLISDTAVLSGGSSPTGKITFAVFGPNDASCAGTAASTSMVTVSGDGTYPSLPFTPTAAGTYRFTAAYSGDAANAVAVSACGATGESVVVTAAGGLGTPAIATTASPTVALGGVISDAAVLSGGSSPTGKITFAVFGPNDASCAGTAVSTSMVTVSGDGTYPSLPFTPTAAGTYRFTAAYSGDAANAVAVSACGAAGESVVVGPATTAVLTTQASGGVRLGGQLTDTATLSGGASPTGTVTFRLFGPADPTCASPAVFTSAKATGGGRSVTSSPFVPGAPGTYRWVASYSGDANGGPLGGACADANESTTVSPAQPALATTTPATGVTGGLASDTATLTGGIAPTGTLRFDLYGPNDPTCSSPIFRATATVNGNGAYASGPFTLAAPGAYSWIVTYGGDANNLSATSPCQSEIVVVAPATTAPPVAAPPPAPTITQVCAGVEAQVDTELPGQTISTALLRGFSFALSATASIEVRLVLRAKDPATGSFVSLTNFLLHVSTPVTAVQTDNGLGANYARRARAFLAASERAKATLLVFKVVHCRPDKQLFSAESVGLLSLAP